MEKTQISFYIQSLLTSYHTHIVTHLHTHAHSFMNKTVIILDILFCDLPFPLNNV